MVWVSMAMGMFGLMVNVGIITHYLFGGHQVSDDPYDTTHSTPTVVATVGFMSLICGTLLVVCKRFVLRMYYCRTKKEFIGITPNLFNPFVTKKHIWKPGAGSPAPEASLGLEGIFGNTFVNKKRFNINEDSFLFPSYYNVFFGHEDPKVLDQVKTNDKDAEDIFKKRRSSVKHLT
jgi:hypothetical protein